MPAAQINISEGIRSPPFPPSLNLPLGQGLKEMLHLGEDSRVLPKHKLKLEVYPMGYKRSPRSLSEVSLRPPTGFPFI